MAVKGKRVLSARSGLEAVQKPSGITDEVHVGNEIREVKSNLEIQLEKQQEELDFIRMLTSFYREHPHVFAKDFLNVNLKDFQKVLLYEMFHNNFILVSAVRGIGKTWLVALYAIIKCILYPGSKVCVAAPTLKQAVAVLEKIDTDFMVSHDWGSDFLIGEIKKITMGKDPNVSFYNGSYIYAVPANNNARSKRATDLIFDEFVQMDEEIIQTVLKPFLTVKREPGFADNPKYNSCVEENKEIYLSSPWYKDHWGYRLAKGYIRKMLSAEPYFVCAFPYQLSIYSGLMSRTRMQDVVDDPDYDPIKGSMEYGGIWYGTNGDEYFNYEELTSRRTLKDSLPTLNQALKPRRGKNSRRKIDKLPNCNRILSIDIALMSGSINDAAVFVINDAMLNEKRQYVANIKFVEAYEGLRTNELGLKAMQIYDLFDCDTIVVDGRGNGQGVVDFITMEQIDPSTGQTYLPFKCVNDDTWAKRTVGNKAINTLWVITASAKFNDQAAVRMKNAIENGSINFLVSEYECNSYLNETINKYADMSDTDQLEYKLHYIETTLLINEMIKLDFDVKGNNVVLKERSGMRKDRYSSVSYNYWVMKELEKKVKPERKQKKVAFRYRQPVYER